MQEVTLNLRTRVDYDEAVLIVEAVTDNNKVVIQDTIDLKDLVWEEFKAALQQREVD